MKSHNKFMIAAILAAFFSACNPGSSFTDTQGNVYPIIEINDLNWMAANLNFAVDSSFCYRNDAAECDTMGRIYTWQGALDAASQIEGWRLPTREEWQELIEFCGGDSLGYKTIISEELGFNPQWAGARLPDNKFIAKKHGIVNYWSSTTSDTSAVLAYSVAIMPPMKIISPHNYPKVNGCSVRLVKD